MEDRLFFFTGENGFALREELRSWIGKFEQKHGAENLLILDASGVRFRELADEVGVAPFIGGKRLVILRGIPAFSAEEIGNLPALMHEHSILVIAAPSPDKRLAAVKILQKAAAVRAFPLLRGSVLIRWMEGFARSNGASFAPRAAAHLAERSGEDQELLAQEIAKLALFTGGAPISPEDIDAVSPPSAGREAWHLTRLLTEGKSEAALRYGDTLLRGGEDPYALWNLLLWMLRTLVTVKAAVESGVRQPAAIASQFRVPPASARNLLPLAARIDMPRLSSLVSWAAEADRELKTGGYRASKDAPEELVALIDRLILAVTLRYAPQSA